MSTKLLIDAMPIMLTLDESSKDGKVIARGEFARCDIPTQNGRKYSRALYEREITRLQETIKRRRCFGELDHPADGKTMLQRVSHLVTDLKLEDDGRVVGEAEILDTPAGKTLKAILSAGAEAGVSSRGFGSTKPNKDGSMDVGSDFVLRTFDFVADPAMKTAYPDVFTEDTDTPEFTVEDLENSFPELVAEAQTRSRMAQDEINDIVEKERQRVKESMEEDFAQKLASALTGIRDDLKEDVRQEYEQAESAQAHVALHKIAQIVGPMVSSASPDEQTMRDALESTQMQVVELENQLQEAKDLLQVSGFAMHVESKIGGHPKRDAIKRLLGKVSHYQNTEELDARIDEITEEFHVVLEAERAKEQVVNEDLEQEVIRLTEETESLHEQIDTLKTQLKRALNEGHDAKVTAYKQKKASGYTNSQELMNLLENAGNESQIDKVVDQFGRRSVSDDSLESLRQRLQRGNLRKETATLEEDSSSPSRTLDVSFSEIKALAGI